MSLTGIGIFVGVVGSLLLKNKQNKKVLINKINKKCCEGNEKLLKHTSEFQNKVNFILLFYSFNFIILFLFYFYFIFVRKLLK